MVMLWMNASIVVNKLLLHDSDLFQWKRRGGPDDSVDMSRSVKLVQWKKRGVFWAFFHNIGNVFDPHP
jgi:hypothetical protein